MPEGVFCVVLGPDGAGKTTLLGNMARRAPGWAYVSAQPEDLYPIAHLECYDWALRTHPRQYVPHMRPLTRAAFFVTTLAVEYEYHIAPALAAGRTVVCDSYWYRFTAKESLQNPQGERLLAELVAHLPRPDLVIWVDVPMELAWRRNRDLTQFEVDGEFSWPGFASFQRAVLDRVTAMVADRAQLTLDGRQPALRLAADAVAAVASALTPAASR